MERFDAIVVGAGPAGSTTAYRLADAGATVLLLDKARFPRDKPCGGGVTGRAVRQLPVPIDEVVEDVVDRVQLRFRYGQSFERRAPAPLMLMTQRRRLDHHLAERAAARGADFRDGVKVERIEVADDGVTVDGARADVLIGADGANGPTARAAGLAGDHTYGVAYEGNAPGADAYRGRAVIELGSVPGGYAWVFPKADHVNVGVGCWLSEGPRLRAHLTKLCRAHGIDERAVESLRGHRLPMRRPGTVLARGRALLVGDAAGLVDPLSGDGMYEAFLSGRLAADAALDVLAGRADRLDPYGPALAAALGQHLAASWGVKLALERFPRAVFGLIPLAWPTVERLLLGELSHPGAARGLARPPLHALELLARAAGNPGAPYRAEAA